MQGQEFDVCDLPFDGYYAPQVETKYRPWGCPLSRHHHGPPPWWNHDGKPGFGPGFDHGPGNPDFQGPDHHKASEDGHQKRGCGRWGPPKHEGDGLPDGVLYHGAPGFRPGHDGRPHDFHGDGAGSNNFGPPAWYFGRRGASESAERPSADPTGGPGHQRP